MTAPPCPAPLRVALVGAEREENLSLRSVAAAARDAGHAPTIVPFNAEDELSAVARRLCAEAPEVVGISLAFQHRIRELLDLASALRAGGYAGHICCGGHTATAAWAEVLDTCPAVDTVVRHDGELTFVELLANLSSPQRWPRIAGLCCRDEGGRPHAAPPRRQPDDLDALPAPLRDRPHAEHVGLGFAPLIGSRGCWGNCTYCCINSWHRSSAGRRLRLRSPAAIADEMAYLYHDRDARIFCFHDDNFFLPRPRDTVRRFEELRAELDRRRVGKVGMVGKCRPDHLELSMLRRVGELGVFRLYLGLENGSEAGLRHLGRRHDLASCHRAVELFGESGMFACYNILLFEPWSRMPDLWDNLELMRRAVAIPSNFCRAEVYAGAALEQMLAEEGRLRGTFLGYGYQIDDERAELAFRLSAICFHSRNFAAEGVANTSTGLGYEGAVLRHFFGAAGEPLAAEVDALVREVNLDTLARLEALLSFVQRCDPHDADAACDFAEQLATAINRRDLELGARQSELRQRILDFGREHRKRLP